MTSRAPGVPVPAAPRREVSGDPVPVPGLQRFAQAGTRAAARRRGVYIGVGAGGAVWGTAEQAVLVIGPPRSGKTTSIVIPSVLAAPGAVVSTSTKPDVLAATVAARRNVGPVAVYDPGGTTTLPHGVHRVRWSPIHGCHRWDDALVVAHGLVGAGRASRGRVDGADHWTERAEALLAPVLHAAALDGVDMATVVGWIDRRQAVPALSVLDREGAAVAGDLLAGIAATDSREQSGIWSTASGVLAAYRSEAALASTVDPDFDARRFCREAGTLYICAAGRHQAVLAPLVVGILTDVRAAAYERSAVGVDIRAARGVDSDPGRRVESGPPVLLALDEVANIAPLPDLPAMVSEGGGQGLLTLACLQDLSQARARWGTAADGFLSLFSTTVVLPGIGDVTTLRALADIAGEEEVVTRSVSAPARAPTPPLRAVTERLLLGRRAGWRHDDSATVTTATVRRPRLALDELSRGRPGSALVLGARNEMGWARLTPWFAEEPWRSAAKAAVGPDPTDRRGVERDPRPAGRQPSGAMDPRPAAVHRPPERRAEGPGPEPRPEDPDLGR